MGKWLDRAREMELRDRGDNIVSLDTFRRRQREDREKASVCRQPANGSDDDYAA